MGQTGILQYLGQCLSIGGFDFFFRGERKCQLKCRSLRLLAREPGLTLTSFAFPAGNISERLL
ncbi:MAG: hypothetical protein CMF59_08695 [Leptospiraceae bacterium]|nr:hypothetical protein [Leptospiraceae bacterium]